MSSAASLARWSTPEERLAKRYAVNADGCWIWQSGLNPGGYGQFRFNGRQVGAHRAAYLMFRGPIAHGLDLDHLCRNRACVNPAHLEPVARSENLRRGEVGQWNRATERCPKGHPYDEANTYHDPRGWRGCRMCRNEAARRYKRRRAA